MDTKTETKTPDFLQLGTRLVNGRAFMDIALPWANSCEGIYVNGQEVVDFTKLRVASFNLCLLPDEQPKITLEIYAPRPKE